jgi:hypothetical protein
MVARPLGVSFRSLRLTAVAAVLVVSGFACGGGSSPSGANTASPSEVPSTAGYASCASGAAVCLAWDDFDRDPGPITEAPSGQVWETWTISYPEYQPVFTTDGSRASMAPGADHGQVWLATIDSGLATGILVSADITMSPTPLHANVGLLALFEDAQNHLSCKIEISPLHPQGLLTFGDQRNDVAGYRLAPLQHTGFENGNTYHLELTVPADVSTDPVECHVSGEGIEPASVELHLNGPQLAAYGAGTKQGLRIHIVEDEDDGGSTWDNYEVRPIV